VNLTTLLDLLGSLLVIAALAVLVGTYSLAAGLAVAGLLLLALSYTIDRQAAARRRRETAERKESTT